MNTSLLKAGDKIKWDTMFHETFEGVFVKQEGGTVHAKRADGTPVLIDAIRVYV